MDGAAVGKLGQVLAQTALELLRLLFDFLEGVGQGGVGILQRVEFHRGQFDAFPVEVGLFLGSFDFFDYLIQTSEVFVLSMKERQPTRDGSVSQTVPRFED